MSASHSNLSSDIRVTKDLQGGRPTTSMKKGWLCRNSCDEKNHEIAPGMIQIEWWSRSSDDDPAVMIQIEWWSRSSSVMLIQIERWSRSSDDVPWWSRLSDDPDPLMMLHDDLDREMIQIQWRWLEDKYDLKTKMTWRRIWLEDEMIQLIQRRRLVLINCVKRIAS